MIKGHFLLMKAIDISKKSIKKEWKKLSKLGQSFQKVLKS